MQNSRKPQIDMDCYWALMSDDKLSQLHEVLKEPLRQKILLQLGQHECLTLDDLTKNLRAYDIQELSNQLSILGRLKVEGEYLISNQADEYELTEKGHYVLDEMIAFPELLSDNYRDKILGEINQSSNQSKAKPKWFTPYWIAIIVSTTILLGIILPIFGNVPFEKALFFLVVSLLIVGLGFYVRIKPLSIRKSRFMYIVLFGGFFGCWFSIGAIMVLSRMGFHEIDAVVITAWIGCFALGGILGDIIGRIRHYKGPGQYSP
jgi:hypothetical protein